MGRRIDDGGNGGFSDLPGRQTTHRLALQVVAALPDDMAAALAVLDRAKFLLECWQLEQEPSEVPQLVVRPRLVRNSD